MKSRNPDLMIACISVGVATFGLAVALLVDSGCTPQQRKDVVPFVIPAEKLTCVLLRSSGETGKDVCATADDLAPFVDAILQAQAAMPQDATLAYAFPLTAETDGGIKRAKRPKRHCTQWVEADAGAKP